MRLSNDPQQRCSVDWLTEVVRRLSEAALHGSMQNVRMFPTRIEKVGLFRGLLRRLFCLTIIRSGKTTRPCTLTGNGFERKLLHLKMLSYNMVQNFD